MASAQHALVKNSPQRRSADVIPIKGRLDIDTNPDSVRMYRLWDAKAKEQLRWRYYADRKRAHMGALYEARWAEIGTTIEVFDVRNGKLLGQYTRRANDIHFLGE